MHGMKKRQPILAWIGTVDSRSLGAGGVVEERYGHFSDSSTPTPNTSPSNHFGGEEVPEGLECAQKILVKSFCYQSFAQRGEKKLTS
jgi:hypothetical protein